MSFQCLVKNPFPHLQFYLIPGRNLLIFISVHCKEAQTPKAHPLLESSDLSQIYQESFAITARAVTVLLFGDLLPSTEVLVFVTKIHVKAFKLSIPCDNHLLICHHSSLTCLFQSWKDDVWCL